MMNDLNLSLLNTLNFRKQTSGSPIGTVITYAGNIENDALSKQWLLCDGSAINASIYPELFRAIGYVYGGNNSTFNLPDFKGQFIRTVVFDNASIDNREASTGIGATPEKELQTYQPEDIGSSAGAIVSDTSQIKVSQDETRPAKTFVNYLIKARCSYEE